MTPSQTVAADLVALFRSRHPLIWVVTPEEQRSQRYIAEAAIAARYLPRIWDCARGVALIDGIVKDDLGGADLSAVLDVIEKKSGRGGDRGVWILKDPQDWFAPPLFTTNVRKLRNLAQSLPGVGRDTAQSIVILTTTNKVPPELAPHAAVIEWPMPCRDEIASIMDDAIKGAVAGIIAEAEKKGKQLTETDVTESVLPTVQRDAAIDAAVGLTGEQAAACYAKSLVQNRAIVPPAISKEKKRVITQAGVLEWVDPIPGGLAAVGGLENLKAWLKRRSSAYTPDARAYGLPAPKGILLAGIPGCGKSLVAKAVAAARGVPLLRLDLGSLKSKYVGDSEQKLRTVFKVIGIIGQCVVWMDEIEKALQGATSGSSDGGVSSDALGALLNWMQERPPGAFLIATANEVESLPPELMRKGRFDEIFFVGLPTAAERDDIIRAAIKSYGRRPSDISTSFENVVDACDGFTGSEISAIVPDAMFNAFADDNREITVEDLVEAAAQVVPLKKTAAKKLRDLENWQKDFGARPASRTEDQARGPDVRMVDLD